MAFDNTTFGTIASTGFTNLHIYKTTDAVNTCLASGYFNVTTDKRYTIKQYDAIMVVNTAGVSVLSVTSATGTSPITTVAV